MPPVAKGPEAPWNPPINEMVVTQTLKALGQLALLWAVYLGSNWLVTVTGLPIPGNVVGVLVLFTLLALGVVKLAQVELAADFLLKHLVFFFVPIAVGLMEWGEVFYDYGLILAAAILASAVLPLLAVGGLSQLLHRRQD
jgi:holin-like protein